MRIRIFHETVYRYESPARGVNQTLRLTPRNHDGQYVLDWRIDVSENCQLDQHEDAFGNIAHMFSVDGPLSEMHVLVEGEVENHDMNGVVRGAIERFPPSLFLRETSLTRLDPKITEYAAEIRREAGDDVLTILHRLLERLHDDMTYDADPAQAAAAATEAFALKRGGCQDLTHVFIAAARSLTIPARYVSGHFHRADGEGEQQAGHAWAEAFVPRLGWVSFDPANGVCATDAHVRVAVGLDYLGAAPVRGSRYGGDSEALDVSVRVNHTARQSQG